MSKVGKELSANRTYRSVLGSHQRRSISRPQEVLDQLSADLGITPRTRRLAQERAVRAR